MNALLESPNWSSTVLLITYDEWGGFFDHVVPPALPDTPQALGFSPAFQDPSLVQAGFRVPLYVVSPFAAPGVVATGRFDHSSIPRFVEWRWGLAPLTPRDAAARNPAAMLDFSQRNPTTHVRSIADPGPHLCDSAHAVSEPFWHDLRDAATERGWATTA